MTKKELRISVAIGLVLACFALFILSFTVYQNKIMEVNNQEKQIKHDLIQEVKDSCSTEYPVVHAAIYRDRIVVECRTE